MTPTNAAILFTMAAVFGLIGTSLARGFAMRIGFVNHPNAIIPSHVKPVAYMGGVGIMLGLLLAVGSVWMLDRFNLMSLDLSTQAGWVVILPATLFLGLGVLDDHLILSAKTKFISQVILAALAVLMGARYSFTHVIFVDMALSCFWIVLVVNALNLTDVCDGLVGSLCLVSLTFLAWFTPASSIFALATAGACVGFLRFNLPAASIYLGDGGSHLLGYLIAVLTLLADRTGTWPYPAVIVLIVGVPLFELGFLVLVRTKKRRPWWKGSPDHFSLRMQQAGFSQIQIDLMACLAAAILCGTATAIDRKSLAVQLGLIFTVMIAATGCCLWLLRHEVTSKKKPCSLHSNKTREMM